MFWRTSRKEAAKFVVENYKISRCGKLGFDIYFHFFFIWAKLAQQYSFWRHELYDDHRGFWEWVWMQVYFGRITYFEVLFAFVSNVFDKVKNIK